MPAYKPKKITLLPDSENSNSFSARALRWLTTVGRTVIIITELVVVGAFLSRFYLDKKNSNLSELIRQQKAIFEATKEFEKQFAVLQKQLELIKTLKSQNPNYVEYIGVLTSATPDNVFFQTLNMSYDEKVKQVKSNLTITSYVDSALISYINNIASHPKVQKVSVKKIEKKPKSADFSVDLEIYFKNG